MSLKSIYNNLVLHRWEIGFVDNSKESILWGEDIHIRFIKHSYKNRWFADPFILSFDQDEIILLAEDYCDSDRIGKISRLVVDRKTYELKDLKVILSLESHLSFPALFREGEKVYVYPENSCAGGLWLYEYDDQNYRCVLIRQLSSEPLTDAIRYDINGENLIISTKEPHPNGNLLDVYRDRNHTGNYEHAYTVKFNENIARNAGDFFECNGQLYRAAQECNLIYGHALSIQRITKEGDSIKMEEVRRIMPPKHAIGIHTFNVYKDLTVVDIKVFRHPWIALPLFRLRNLFKK